LFLAYTGCRWGEMAALRVGNVDFLRRRARIVEAVTLVRGVQTWGTPKGHECREVPLPPFLVDELAAHVAGMQPDDLLFTGTKGGPIRSQVFQRAVLTRAAASIGLDHFHPHELRHTAASLAIASGADVKVVQQMLGHKSATMTLDLYGHLFEHRLDEVAAAMDAARSRGLLADCLRTGAELITLPTYAGKH
jgi:integrase